MATTEATLVLERARRAAQEIRFGASIARTAHLAEEIRQATEQYRRLRARDHASMTERAHVAAAVPAGDRATATEHAVVAVVDPDPQVNIIGATYENLAKALSAEKRLQGLMTNSTTALLDVAIAVKEPSGKVDVIRPSGLFSEGPTPSVTAQAAEFSKTIEPDRAALVAAVQLRWAATAEDMLRGEEGEGYISLTRLGSYRTKAAT